jgi:hypothetical protein
MVGGSVFVGVRRVLIGMALVVALPLPSLAQNVGTGPLTGSLSETEPTSGVFDWKIVKVAPGLVIDELGVDSNIFDEAVDPKDDWVFRGKPDLALFSAVRFAKLSAYLGSQFAYYKSYPEEQSLDYEYRARLDLLISRMHPFIGGGETNSRTRPTVEIDTRADRKETELSGGFAFDLGPHQQIYGAASRYRSHFFNSIEEGVDLSTALNHDTITYSGGIQTDLTPLMTLTLFGALGNDEFESMASRNTENRSVTASIQIGAEAVISGNVAVTYLDTKPVDPLVEPYHGVNVAAGIAYPFLEIGRLTGSYNHGLQYSFDSTEAYYIESTASLAYTHRLFGEVDAQVRGSKSWLDYGYREGTPARQDTTAALGAGFGYNLKNRTRISVNYEVSERRSPAFPERNFNRTRIFLSWAYAF